MNEADTRAELIDPKLKAVGWSVVEGSKILREHPITAGKIQAGIGRAKPFKKPGEEAEAAPAPARKQSPSVEETESSDEAIN